MNIEIAGRLHNGSRNYPAIRAGAVTPALIFDLSQLWRARRKLRMAPARGVARSPSTPVCPPPSLAAEADLAFPVVGIGHALERYPKGQTRNTGNILNSDIRGSTR